MSLRKGSWLISDVTIRIPGYVIEVCCGDLPCVSGSDARIASTTPVCRAIGGSQSDAIVRTAKDVIIMRSRYPAVLTPGVTVANAGVPRRGDVGQEASRYVGRCAKCHSESSSLAPVVGTSDDAARTISMLIPTSEVHTSFESMRPVSHCCRAHPVRNALG